MHLALIIRAPLAAFIAMLLPISIQAQEWESFADEQLEFGTVSVGGYDLSVFCSLSDGDFAIHYNIPTSLVHDNLRELEVIGLTFAFDQKHDNAKPSVGVESSRFDYPSATATALVAIHGRSAMDIAKQISRANRSITVAVTPDAAVSGGPQYNKTTFPAAGSTQALSHALAACKDAWL